MAEKEERIAIAKMLTGLDDDGSAQLDHFKLYSRQEAIEKIAKAICKFEMTLETHCCKECTEDCTDHLEMDVVDKATEALDALLGESND